MDGVLVIDKPEGPTSHDVVARVRRATGIARVGHTGTLDPLASGVLPLVLGRAARLAQFLTMTDKEYEAIIRLGLETDTYDITGQPVSGIKGVGSFRVSRAEVDNVLQKFRGSYLQSPPPFSAKKIGGTPAYALARRGRPVQPGPSAVVVRRLDLTEIQGDLLRLRLTCSAGYYVRSLAHDLGDQLRTGACLQALRRVRSGDFGLASAVSLEAVERDPASALASVIPMSRLLTSLPGVVLTRDGLRRAAKGNLVGPTHVHGAVPAPGARVRLLDEEGHLVAIAEPAGESGLLHPGVVVV